MYLSLCLHDVIEARGKVMKGQCHLGSPLLCMCRCLLERTKEAEHWCGQLINSGVTAS